MIKFVQKWGNSQDVRIQKVILEKVNIKENDKVEIIEDEGKIIIIPVKEYK